MEFICFKIIIISHVVELIIKKKWMDLQIIFHI